MPKSAVKAPICEVTIRPLVDIIVIITNSSQNTGVRSILRGPTLATSGTRRPE